MTVTSDLTPEACLRADEVQIGTNDGPGIYVAPPGTDLPATTQTPFADPWQCLGYLSDDGPTIGSSTDSEQLTPWQSAAPIKNIITSRQVTMQFVMWQLNPLTLALYFDTEVPAESGDGELDFVVRTDQAGQEHAVAVAARDGNRVLRIGFLRATLTDAGDMQIQRGAVIPLDVTMAALETSGQLAHIQLGRATAGPMAASANGVQTEAAPTRTPAGGRRHHDPAPTADLTS